MLKTPLSGSGRRAALGALASTLLGACGALRPEFGAPAPVPARSAAAAKLTSQQRQWARTAWRYVENNTDPATGLVSGTDRSPLFTTWNAADALAAVMAAHELGVIGERDFDFRIGRLLGFLAGMALSGGALPNKAYSTSSGKMVGFENRPEDIGWSAIDIGRLMLWLKILGQRHPRFQEYADKVLVRWNFCDVIDDCGALFGTARRQGQVQRYPEGRLGYEQLAGAGYAAWGFQAGRSAGLPPTRLTNVYGLPLRLDARDDQASSVPAPVLTMPYVLMGIELGWRGAAAPLREIGERVFRLQEERWLRERQLTARSDYQLREAPWVVLDSVFAQGYAWNTLGVDGRPYEKLALVSTRAAFGMWALRPGEYAERLIDTVRLLYDEDRGWYEGRSEATGAAQTTITLSTNAAILETLLFKATGPLLAPGGRPGYFALQLNDPFQPQNLCWPTERLACGAPAAAPAPLR